MKLNFQLFKLGVELVAHCMSVFFLVLLLYIILFGGGITITVGL